MKPKYYCSGCDKTKESALFSKNKSKKTGVGSWCKECCKKYRQANKIEIAINAIEYSAKNREQLSNYQTTYRKTVPGEQAHKKSKDKQATRYPEKLTVHSLWLGFIRKNGIPRSRSMNFHHWSYDIKYFTDVLLMPTWFHVEIHKHMTYNQEHKCYEGKNWGLLDTKEKHMMYISSWRYA